MLIAIYQYSTEYAKAHKLVLMGEEETKGELYSRNSMTE